MPRKFAALCLLFFIVHANARADSMLHEVWADAKNTVTETWGADNYELFVPVNTWHNRHFYSQEKVDEYNEEPWGLGLGKYRYDAAGNWHSVYLIAFKDSHSKPEPVAGYAFQKIWHPSNHIRLGLGYTIGVTLREDLHYMPLPVVAPIASIEYKQLALQSTYIVGGQDRGNILFTWLKWQINQ